MPPEVIAGPLVMFTATVSATLNTNGTCDDFARCFRRACIAENKPAPPGPPGQAAGAAGQAAGQAVAPGAAAAAEQAAGQAAAAAEQAAPPAPEPADDFAPGDPDGTILALNSNNYFHWCRRGYEQYIKTAATVKPPKRTRARAGDGTSFHSCIEVVIRPPPHIAQELDIAAGKIYKLKCFPSKGSTQVPGTIRPDFRDGIAVVEAWTRFLRAIDMPTADHAPVDCAVDVNRLVIVNFRFPLMLAKRPPQCVDFERLYAALENRDRYAFEGMTIRIVQYSREENHFSMQIQLPEGKSPMVHVFRSGKINILGAQRYDDGTAIYRMVTNIFRLCWDDVIRQ